ncbi:MAG: STAS domain-containing protein [Leptospiraceae bacterium]|nr:STAS domain-containing protein [Leptospiraceae bacterium]MCP5512246.1 STAS domain-containing protein [Leptospiraceae bacterium]
MNSEEFDSPDFRYEGTDLKIITRSENHPDLPDDGAIVDIKGDLNLYSTPHLKNILGKLVEVGKNKIFINTAELNYIDSSGLGAFLNIQSKLMKTNGFIRICAPTRQVTSILELTKLKTMLRVSRTLEDGLKGKL